MNTPELPGSNPALEPRTAIEGEPSSPGPMASDRGNAGPTAAAVVAWWQTAGDALAPVVGPRGVAALRRRCLHLAAVRHPFLSSADVPGSDPTPALLHELLVAQPESDALAAGASLARTLSALLEGLVGPSLTQRLLHGVQPPSPDDLPAQDTPP